MFIQFDRAHIGQFQSVQQGEVVGGVISFVEDERRFSRRPRGTSPLFEPTLKLLQHLRKLFCIVAVAFINVVKQWQGFIGRAEQRIADLPKILVPSQPGSVAGWQRASWLETVAKSGCSSSLTEPT